MLKLWRICRGGMGYGPLIESGGVLDQAAWLLDAFAALGGMEAEADEAERKARG